MLQRRRLMLGALAAPIVGSRAEAQYGVPATETIRDLLAEYAGPGSESLGYVAGIGDAGGHRVISVGASGAMDQRALDGSGVFEIGSITKVFTALLMAEMGGENDNASTAMKHGGWMATRLWLLPAPLRQWRVALREAVCAGEPLNPEVIEQVQRAWGVLVRDGWGQTEATVQIANAPGQPVRIGSLGRELPGCKVAVLDENDQEASEGELALPLKPRPPGLMLGYLQEDGSLLPLQGAYYRAGDAVRRDTDGTFTYIGRVDDVFKSSDYRISPFELESVLIEHPAVVEAAVVPSPDPVRLVVPKAFIALSSECPPNSDTALSIFQHIRVRLAPYKRIRRLAFTELPKNVAGKIRRVELRQSEAKRGNAKLQGEFDEGDFPELASPRSGTEQPHKTPLR